MLYVGFSVKPPIENQVKHLLIIISILLHSSPLYGDNHKGETLYRWGESPNYKWMGFGEKDIQPVYKGQVKNGRPHGLGVINLLGGNKYFGEWKNGELLIVVVISLNVTFNQVVQGSSPRRPTTFLLINLAT